MSFREQPTLIIGIRKTSTGQVSEETISNVRKTANQAAITKFGTTLAQNKDYGAAMAYGFYRSDSLVAGSINAFDNH